MSASARSILSCWNVRAGCNHSSNEVTQLQMKQMKLRNAMVTNAFIITASVATKGGCTKMTTGCRNCLITVTRPYVTEHHGHPTVCTVYRFNSHSPEHHLGGQEVYPSHDTGLPLLACHDRRCIHHDDTVHSAKVVSYVIASIF